MFHTWGLYDAMNPTILPVRTMHHFLLSSVITRPSDCTRISFGSVHILSVHVGLSEFHWSCVTLLRSSTQGLPYWSRLGRNQAAALHDCNCNKRHASDLYVQRYRTSTFSGYG
ncbi:hypothetical protein NCU16343 [Neurospora crassa OR74A]|uniref:Uncharacterized protein n=1 Tax=Neurospora crassa (strain ATCC 24698 / 74-OR23-1A / CBS 708.71 / DSM 1257 / FGSC 987) TaxID=367110 RepID=V5IP46_NEUCR|nr:hypothetical protein NCU16343 [Neurospora crassa OR74A]ESA43852.1 hypothetical protein NCU16343 [Neurospora crassa OR74A]|eukprot:XP_011393347.1 hypothetical protein NCU16343 [Neurospora crassa OR74A]